MRLGITRIKLATMVVGKYLHIYNVDHGSKIKLLCDLVQQAGSSRHVARFFFKMGTIGPPVVEQVALRVNIIHIYNT